MTPEQQMDAKAIGFNIERLSGLLRSMGAEDNEDTTNQGDDE